MKDWFQSNSTTVSLGALSALLIFAIRPDDFGEVLITFILILICAGLILLVRVMGSNGRENIPAERRLFIVEKGKIVALLFSYGVFAVFLIDHAFNVVNGRSYKAETSAFIVLSILGGAVALHLAIEWVFKSLAEYIELAHNSEEK